MNLRRVLQLFSVAICIFSLDYVAKALTTFFIQPFEYAPGVFPFGGIPVFQNFFGIDFCLNNVGNRGAAWGMFGSMQIPLLIFRTGVIIGLLGYLFFSPKSKPHHFPLVMIITGALGNVIDYFIYGHVIDMFHFVFWGYSYPVFNIADSAIFCGIGWMALQSMGAKKRHAAASN